MRSLSSALNTALGGAVQRPAWLVYIGWTSPVRLSTHGTVSYGGQTWTAADVDLSDVRVEAARVSGSIRLGNADDLYGAAVLNEGVSDKAIQIIGYDAGAVAADADFVALVSCVGARATIGAERVVISLRDSNEFVYAPRTFITDAPGSGFTYFLPAGAVVTINGASYRIERK